MFRYVCSYLLLLSAKLLMIIGLVCTPVTLNVVGLFVFTVMNGAGMSAFETSEFVLLIHAKLSLQAFFD